MSDFVSFTKTWHNEPYPAIDPKRPELSTNGKFVVITGGATGIGKAIAVAFAQAGAQTIAIVGRRIEKLESAAAEITKAATASNVKVLFESADMSKRASLDAAVASLTKKAGGPDVKVDILVHSAAVSQDQGPVMGYDESQYRYGLELNVIGAFNALQAFTPVLAVNAHIYNISSGMAHIAPIWVKDWAYAAGKAAVVKMFDYLQAQQPEWHIVQLQPGVVSTEINARFVVVGQDPPELCGHFAVWLASPEAAFLKSKFVWANWDVEELKARADELKNSNLLRVALNGVDM
ncbi:NAD(P)-binding protein [Cadophora sp. DSE1049]|nr:NAD(P)-binding protein [Cadophora sp. DSE1049]